MSNAGTDPRPSSGNPWNSLEICKLVVGTLTPLSLLVITTQINNSDKERTERSTKFERVAAKRTEIWSNIGPHLNDIYVYILYVGHWKKMNAVDIVNAKRQADKTFYANRPFFSDEFAKAYTAFMNASFQTGNGMGTDAMPRASADFRKLDDDKLVTNEDNAQMVHESYYHLLDVIADDFSLKVSTPKRPSPQT